MDFNKISAAEAAALIQNGQTIGLSGFTPAGVPKCTPAEIAKKAAAEHAAGRPFKISVFTGASTGQSCDGELSNAEAIDFRAPYTTNPDFRKNVNRNSLNYSDLNLSNMATQIRQGYLGPVNWAIIEACDVERVGSKAHIYLTAAGGISPTVCRLATEGIIIELNAFHSPKSKGIHDVYEIEDHPHRTPIMINKASDRIGKPYVEVDASRIVGVVECNIPDEARAFKDPDPITSQIGQNVADFLRPHPLFVPQPAERCRQRRQRRPGCPGSLPRSARLQHLHRGASGRSRGPHEAGSRAFRQRLLSDRHQRVSARHL